MTVTFFMEVFRTIMDDIYTTSVILALRESGGVGPKLFQTILSVFGSPENVYAATFEQLTDLPRLSEEHAEQILGSQHSITFMGERIERLSEEGISVVTFLDDEYPSRLRSMDDPPPVLYYKGHFPNPDQKSIAVVGRTDASAEAIEATVDIAAFLVKKGCSIVSGLARGIDTAAHVGAIKNEGISHAVVASGFYEIYPPENKALAEQLLEKGSLMCEYPPDTGINTGRLLGRNRIIVGLSDSVIVGELSPDSSGTFSAAESAETQGKLLFYLLKGDESKRGVTVPQNAIPFDTIDDLTTILETSIGS